LNQAEVHIRNSAIESLTGVPLPKWKDLDLDNHSYQTWLNYLKDDINQQYGHFSSSINVTYSSDSISKGNSLISYHHIGRIAYGKIKFFFRSKAIPKATFLLVEPFTPLDTQDSIRNFYLHHLLLRETIVYNVPSSFVIVDSCDVIGHVAAVKKPPGSFHISYSTYSMVSLQNAVSGSYHILEPRTAS
ncbi:hypothetical protein DFH28DRAFT_890342, partial [Melampsora americana]